MPTVTESVHAAARAAIPADLCHPSSGTEKERLRAERHAHNREWLARVGEAS